MEYKRRQLSDACYKKSDRVHNAEKDVMLGQGVERPNILKVYAKKKK